MALVQWKDWCPCWNSWTWFTELGGQEGCQGLDSAEPHTDLRMPSQENNLSLLDQITYKLLPNSANCLLARTPFCILENEQIYKRSIK